MNTFFKFAFLIVAVIFLILLYGIYNKIDRYKVMGENGITRVLDTQTGKLYYYSADGWFILNSDGSKKFDPTAFK